MRGIGTKDKPPTFTQTLYSNENPDFFDILGVQQLIGSGQAKHRKSVKPFLDILQKGPYNAEDALKLGFIDGMAYHQDLLAWLANNGIKTWSLRKYCDAKIVRAFLGDLDTDMMLIPQMWRGKKSSKEKEIQEKEAARIPRGVVEITEPSESSPVEDISISMKVILPQTVGVIFLDREIER